MCGPLDQSECTMNRTTVQLKTCFYLFPQCFDQSDLHQESAQQRKHCMKIIKGATDQKTHGSDRFTDQSHGSDHFSDQQKRRKKKDKTNKQCNIHE